MAIDVTASVKVDRQRSEVAAFLENPANDLRWIRALTSAERLTDGAFGKGTRVRRVARMLGREMTYTTEITSYEPGTTLAMKTTEGPIAMIVTYSLADAGEGTRVSVRNQGGSGFVFAVFGPLIGLMVNGRVKGDLKQLKRTVEQDPPTHQP